MYILRGNRAVLSKSPLYLMLRETGGNRGRYPRYFLLPVPLCGRPPLRVRTARADEVRTARASEVAASIEDSLLPRKWVSAEAVRGNGTHVTNATSGRRGKSAIPTRANQGRTAIQGREDSLARSTRSCARALRNIRGQSAPILPGTFSTSGSVSRCGHGSGAPLGCARSLER